MGDDDYVTIKFRLLNENYELLFSAAAYQGEHMEVALNRATALYELLHRAEPGDLVTWADKDGAGRRILVLPAKLPLPWFLRWLDWLGVEVGIQQR